ncbi:MAG: arginyltransferase, partial [Pseudomonadota bacterium]
HAQGGMADMDAFDYASMVDETPVNSTVIEYTLIGEDGERRLMGACLSDILGDGLSMVYSFFEPEAQGRSLGAYMILDHVRLAEEMGLHYVYLGYWVSGSPKMAYKTQYRPFELCDGARWRGFSSAEEFTEWRARQPGVTVR